MKKRVPFWDVARFAAIIMVVFWHFIYCSPDFDKNTISLTANFIVGVNMPMFFAISGYFARKMLLDSCGRKLTDRIIMCLWPVVLFSTIRTILGFCHGDYTCSGALPRYVKYLLMDHWFINCLIVCQCATFIVCLVARKRNQVMYAGLALTFIVFWACPRGLWYSLSMIPFYWLGVFSLHRLLDDAGGERRVAVMLGIVALFVYCVIVGLEGNVMTNGMGFYWDRMCLLHFSWQGFGLMLARYVTGSIGVFGVLTLILMLCRLPRISGLAPFGQQTLGVYLTHCIFILEFYRGVRLKSIWMQFGCAVLLFFVCHYIVTWTKKCSKIKLLIWGPI